MKKDTKESVDLEDFEEEEKLREHLSLGIDLNEAEFDDKERTAVVTIIKEGWSKNYTGGKQRYYSGRAVADVASLLNTSKKLYLDHSQKERSMAEWGATCKESWVVEDKGKKSAKAKIDFTDNPNTSWLYTEAKKHPEEVGLSIHGSGDLRVGKIGSEDAAIVESVTSLKSVDFVTVPAAGGAVEKVLMASVDEDRALFVLNESRKSLEKILADKEKNDQPYTDYYRLMDALSSFMSGLLWTSEVTSKDVGSEIDKALNTFSDKVKNVFVKIKKNEGPEEDETESVKPNKESKKMTLEEMKTTEPEAYDKLMEQANLLAKNDAEKEVKEKVDTLESEKAQLQTAKDEVEKQLKEAQDKLTLFEDEKAKNDKKEFIAGKLEEVKLTDKVDDEFKALLETVDNAVAEKMITEMAKTFTNIADGKVKGFGPSTPAKKKEEDAKPDYKTQYFEKKK